MEHRAQAFIIVHQEYTGHNRRQYGLIDANGKE